MLHNNNNNNNWWIDNETKKKKNENRTITEHCEFHVKYNIYKWACCELRTFNASYSIENVILMKIMKHYSFHCCLNSSIHQFLLLFF